MRHRSYIFALDRYLIYVYTRIFAIWDRFRHTFRQNVISHCDYNILTKILTPRKIFGWTDHWLNGPLAVYVKLRVGHAPGMPGTFSPPPRISDPDMHRDTCVTYVPWCMPGSLTSGFLWNQWRGKLCRHSRRMRNQQILRMWKEAHDAIWWVTLLQSLHEKPLLGR